MSVFCIIVLGVPRSGTSAVAGILHHLGVFMGSAFGPATEMNPRGFFEDREVVLLHNRFLDYSAFPETVILTNNRRSLEDYAGFARKRESLEATWGFKDRYTPFLFHIAKKAIAHPIRVIATERPFHESVHSWSEQRKVSIAEAKKVLGDTLYARDLTLAEFTGPVMRVPYHELIANPSEWVKAIAFFAGKTPTPEAIEFIDPSLRRHC